MKQINEKILNVTADLTHTACYNFEDIQTDKQAMIKVLNKQKVEDINEKEYRTIYQFYKASLNVFGASSKLTFDDILKINEIVEHKLSFSNGEFATEERYIGTFDDKYITIPPQIEYEKKQNFEELINQLENINNTDLKIHLILNFFIDQIVEQWFDNGNKRTALLVCNKLLLDYCCNQKNNLLLTFNSKKFKILLGYCYLEKYNQPFPKDNYGVEKTFESYRQELILFLRNAIMWNQPKLDFDVSIFKQIKTFFDLDFNLTESELHQIVNGSLEYYQNQAKYNQEFKKQNKVNKVASNISFSR